ncbi:MAG: lysophospholipid acyltransferase family protein [Elusimicrobiota bacterium]|jgi:KDO2-lipid IV(A) lauroyltransferase
MSIFLSVPIWFALTGLGLAVSCLPRGLELVLGRWLGRALLHSRFFRVSVAQENIRHCLPELSEEERRRLLVRNFEHYGLLAFEYLHMFSPLPGHFREYSRRIAFIEGAEHWDKALAEGKGVFFVSAHLGFWEMIGGFPALSRGRPITAVTTVLEPPWLDRRINASRLSLGVKVALHPGSVPTILRALRKGETVAFMNDQYSNPPMGMPVRFFGVRVNTLAAVAPLARRTGAPIVPGWGWREEDGRMHVRIEPAMEFSESQLEDAEGTTTAIAARVEQWVRARPEQWLWMHRRFKHVDWDAVGNPVPDAGSKAGMA